MKFLFTLLALVSARRIEQDIENQIEVNATGPSNKLTQVQPKEYELVMADHSKFLTMQNPVMVKSLEIPPGQSLVVELQERRKMNSRLTNNWYDLFVSGKNGNPLPKPIQIGTSVSNMLRQNFKDNTGKKITMMRFSKRPSIKTLSRAYITQSPARNPVYYTFEKLSMWGMRSNSQTVGYVGWKEEVFTVYYGKCPRGAQSKGKPGCNGLAITAKGHFLGFNFKFYKPGQTEPVAFMTMKHRYWGLAGKKERFEMTVNSGGDVLMLAHLVAFIDLCNNAEAAQQN